MAGYPASEVGIGSPSGPAGGVLSGTYPNPGTTSLLKLDGSLPMSGPLTLDGGVAGGAQAISYAQAYQLVTGTAGLLQNYSISTTVGGVPANGTIRYNNATQTSATQLLMSVITSDGLDLTNFIAQLAPGDTMYLQQETSSANFQRWQVTVAPSIGGGYAAITVTLLASAGTGTTGFANALPIIIYGRSSAAPMTTDGLPEGVVNLYFTEPRVLGTDLAGWVVGANSTVLDTDTITQAIGKLQGQVNAGVTSLAALANGKIDVGNGSGVRTAVTPSGDWTMTNAGVSTIANDAITTAKILNSNVTTAKIADANVTLAKIANIATARILGRTTAASGVVEELTAAQAGTVLGLVFGATSSYVQLGNGGAQVTGTYPVVAADVGKSLECNSGSPFTVTFDFTLFSLSGQRGWVEVTNIGAGTVTLAGTGLVAYPATNGLTVPQGATATVRINSTSSGTARGTT